MPRTVHSVHIMLSRAFSDTVTQRLLSDNPVTAAARVRQTRKGHTVWDPEQLRRFLTQARPERLYPMWLMFATTGMRRSEAAGARRHTSTFPPAPSPSGTPAWSPADRPTAPTARPADPAAASPSTTAPSPPSPPTSPHCFRGPLPGPVAGDEDWLRPDSRAAGERAGRDRGAA